MELPKYKTVNITKFNPEEIELFLRPEMNLSFPVVINIKQLPLDQQREIIGLIENFFMLRNMSYLFPYPIYLISDHDQSMTRMPVAKDPSHLPRFFDQRETKVNVKESQVLGKNTLLQKEISNSDFHKNQILIEDFSQKHKEIYKLEIERTFYRFLLNKLNKKKK